MHHHQKLLGLHLPLSLQGRYIDAALGPQFPCSIIIITLISFSYSKNTLGSNLMCDKRLKIVVGHFLEPFNASNVCPYDRLLFFVHSDSTEDLCIRELGVVEVLQSWRLLALVLLIEDDLASGRVVVDFKLYAHWLFRAGNYSAHNDDLVLLSEGFLTSLICCPSISRVSSGLTGASVIILRVTGVKTWFLRGALYCWL